MEPKAQQIGKTLIAYPLSEELPAIVPADYRRAWMTEAQDKFPYRCLPLSMANQLGWDLLNPVEFSAVWYGGTQPEDVKLFWPTGRTSTVPMAHFGAGTLTFGVHYLFRTPPGVALLAMGPPNWPIDGLLPLMGYIETDWLPATFTMNYLFTRPNEFVSFPAGMPFCRIMPYPRNWIDDFQPEFQSIQDDPELKQRFEAWSESRRQFNVDLKVAGTVARARRWQRDYFPGSDKLGPQPEDHQTRIDLRGFVDKRSK